MSRARLAGADEEAWRYEQRFQPSRSLPPTIETLCREWGEVVRAILTRRAKEYKSEQIKA
ncbi:MAG: hypothetical protein HY664_06750 [Chloroflexi bacterium]|nr:hypothetical protein [Chloroflexota bacterium]